MKTFLTTVCLLMVINLFAGSFTSATVFGQGTQTAANAISSPAASSDFTINDLLDVYLRPLRPWG